VISQGKVVALDRWGGKRNHLSITHRLANNYAKNYCNWTYDLMFIGRPYLVRSRLCCSVASVCRLSVWNVLWLNGVS